MKHVRLESVASLSQVFTTVPLHTLCLIYIYIYMGMPGIPYVLKYAKFTRNTFSLICTPNIKHNIVPENLGLWVCQAYLMCWNMYWNLYKRYARNTLCKMLVSIFFIFIIRKTIASQCSSYNIVPHYSTLVVKFKMKV